MLFPLHAFPTPLFAIINYNYSHALLHFEIQEFWEPQGQQELEQEVQQKV